MSDVPPMGVSWFHNVADVAMRRGVRRVTSVVLLMCQRRGGLLLMLVVIEGALALTAMNAGKTEKETGASKSFIRLLHDLCVLRVNFLFLEAKVYCSLLHRSCSTLMQNWHSYWMLQAFQLAGLSAASVAGVHSFDPY